MKKPALEPAIIVIFGITGDLAKRKLLPALYHLVKDNLLHRQTAIIGLSRQRITVQDMLETIKLCVNEVDGVCDDAAVEKLKAMLTVRSMDMTKAGDYGLLKTALNDVEVKHGVCMNRLFYLSIPPTVAEPIINMLGDAGLNGSCKHGNAAARLLVEKPFGYDTASALELLDAVSRHFNEDQVFRIDHYLAKETVQDILAFRFNNPIFEPVWNGGHVSSIEVVATEKLDIEGRANFYEQTGALRDLIQSHLLQVLALVTMQHPDDLSSESIHERKLELLQAVKTIEPDRVTKDAVRGQYGTYRDEVNNRVTNTETYAAVRLQIENDTWRGVPVVVRTGKALDKKSSRVVITFKPTKTTMHHNVLTFRLQPDEGIELSLRVKKPGFEDEIERADMDFSYDRSFADAHEHPDAYERVLVDAVRGDHTLFATRDEIIESWRIVNNVLHEWSKSGKELIVYKKGSEEPEEHRKLLKQPGV